VLVIPNFVLTCGQRPRDSAREREANERELEQHIWNLRMLSEQLGKIFLNLRQCLLDILTFSFRLVSTSISIRRLWSFL
jgi:hypothetical protein